MADRNPSSFGNWWDETALRPGERIIETVPDKIVTGQQFIFDQAELVVSDVFKTIRTTQIHETTWAAAMEILRYQLIAIDMCGEDGAAGTHKLFCGASVWVDSGATGIFRFQTLQNGDSSNSATFTNTTPAWVQCSGSIDCDGDGTYEEIQMDLRLTAGETYAYCNGVYAWMMLL